MDGYFNEGVTLNLYGINQPHYKPILTVLINISKMDKKGKAPMLRNC